MDLKYIRAPCDDFACIYITITLPYVFISLFVTYYLYQLLYCGKMCVEPRVVILYR